MKTSLCILSLFIASQLTAQSTIMVGTTEVEVDTVYSGLDIPWEIIYGADDHLWTTERRGIISRINPVLNTKTVILDLTAQVYNSAEAGLLGMALHPNFSVTPEVFFAYTYLDGSDIKERIVKYTYNGTNLVSPQTLIEDITGNTTHIGARFHFMDDGTLLVSTGDAQNTSLPQNLSSLSGKILRMNTDGSIPADNPIGGSYVYSFGHRNVQGIMQAPNGIIYLSEHGASTDDEFQILEENRNYGWPNVEGFCDPGPEETFCLANNVKEPLVVWTPTIAPSDMIYYENPEFPEFDGKVLMTVLKDKRVVAIELNAAGTQVVDQTDYLVNAFGRLRDICVGPNNEIYLATNGPFWSNTNPNTHNIVVLRPASSASVKQLDDSTIEIFPNPVSDLLQVTISADLIGSEAKIVDAQGKLISTQQLTAINTGISTGNLVGGLYFLHVEKQNGATITKRFSK